MTDLEDWQAAYDERSGFLEFCGGYVRAQAEALARKDIFAQRGSLVGLRMTVARVVPVTTRKRTTSQRR